MSYHNFNPLKYLVCFSRPSLLFPSNQYDPTWNTDSKLIRKMKRCCQEAPIDIYWWLCCMDTPKYVMFVCQTWYSKCLCYIYVWHAYRSGRCVSNKGNGQVASLFLSYLRLRICFFVAWIWVKNLYLAFYFRCVLQFRLRYGMRKKNLGYLDCVPVS